jgi:hypothetical protein
MRVQQPWQVTESNASGNPYAHFLWNYWLFLPKLSQGCLQQAGNLRRPL